jgi:hypothetical protein
VRVPGRSEKFFGEDVSYVELVRWLGGQLGLTMRCVCVGEELPGLDCGFCGQVD